MQKFRLRMVGVAPLLMHNGQLADPLNEIARALGAATGKRKKTVDDHLEVARLEYIGSAYLDPDVGPFLPGENVWRCLYDAAKFSRLGEAMKRGLLIDTQINPLAYTGPRTIEALFADQNFVFRKAVKTQATKVVRTRPMFREWAVDAEGQFDPAQVSPDRFAEIVQNAGMLVGLGDWRPRYGLFIPTLDLL